MWSKGQVEALVLCIAICGVLAHCPGVLTVRAGSDGEARRIKKRFSNPRDRGALRGAQWTTAHGTRRSDLKQRGSTVKWINSNVPTRVYAQG